MFYEPAPSPYDLNFRLLGVPVRVQPMFWLFSAIFGWGYMKLGFGYLLLHMVVIFVSFLVHEMGHVLMGRAFGEPGRIVLSSFFGLAIGNYDRVRRWKRIAISFAGPAGDFLLVGLAWLIGSALAPQWNWFNVIEVLRNLLIQPLAMSDFQRWTLWFCFFLMFSNLFIGFLNLLPVYPLDGGRISRELCTMASRRGGERFSLGLSFLVAGLIAVYSLIAASRPEDVPYPPLDPIFNAILFGLLAVQNWQWLRAHTTVGRWSDEDGY